MAQFCDMILTNAGRNLLAKCIKGKQLRFSRAMAGDGVIDGYETIPNPETEREQYIEFMNTVAEMTNLVSPIREMEIRGIETPPQIGTATIKTLLSNEGCSIGFFFNEIGLFAKAPDTDEEVLYGYCSAGNKGDFMPGQGLKPWAYGFKLRSARPANAVKYYFDLVVVIGQAESVTAIFSDAPASVTVEELDDRLNDILKYIQTQNDLLQYQIDCLAVKNIKDSLDKAEAELKGEA